MSGYCYKIQHKTNNDLKKYYGSTEDLYIRETDHKSGCYNITGKEYNSPKYQYIRDNGGWENFEMIKIYEGKDYELKEKEYIISTWEINTNSRIPLQTDEEKKENQQKRCQKYYHVKKEVINLYNKEYRQLNKDALNSKARQKIPCDNCGAIINRNAKPMHKKSKKCMEFNTS